ncbi:MAG: EI24 domain-containing protein [Deltaproteobacteria bacterium]|nr:EI24 domain-containing protein [Deltaproteobacteria bacterium]
MKRQALSFFSGVKAVFGGLGFVVSTPSAWGWASIPVLVATVLFGGIGALTIWLGTDLAHRLLWDAGDGTGTVVAIWALRVLFWSIGLVVAFVVAMSLAQPISGFALERIARKQETALGGPSWPDQPFVAGTIRSLQVSLTALVVGLPILAVLAVITFLVPPLAVVTVPLKFIVTGVLAAYDLLDYPLSIRGQGVGERVAFMKAHFSAVLGFGCAVAALLLIPGFGLFLLPFGVAGAARMVAQRDANAQ